MEYKNIFQTTIFKFQKNGNYLIFMLGILNFLMVGFYYLNFSKRW